MNSTSSRLDSLSSLEPGDHLCLPYESEDERRTTLLAFLREGLARHERCLYVAAPAEHAEVVAALEADGVAARRAVARGTLTFATQAEVYLRTGDFDGDDALDVLEGHLGRALADGYAGLRATGESSGPISDELWPRVRAYEARLNERFARRPFVGLCRFDAAGLPPERIQDMLRTHPLAVVRGDLCENPFYERPELALSDDPRARLDWQLHQLRAHQRARRHLAALATSAVTTAAALEAERQRRDDDGPQAARARERYLAVLTEDLAAPLFALKRDVHALSAGLDDTPSPLRLQATARHLRHLSTAIEQARDVAQLLDAEPSVLDACDLVQLVREVARRHGEAFAVAGCTLTLDVPARLSGLWDKVAVQRLLSALLLNAATRGAGRPVTLTIGAEGEDALVTFGDAGTGPDAALADRATGLGLSLARDLAAAAGGRLSSTARGYTVALPRTPTSTAPRG
jgi:signal transduction histidine kinase